MMIPTPAAIPTMVIASFAPDPACWPNDVPLSAANHHAPPITDAPRTIGIKNGISLLIVHGDVNHHGGDERQADPFPI